jgi:hypothetical protein
LDKNESILQNFTTSGLWERHRRFGIKIFIIHLWATQTLIERRLFKAKKLHRVEGEEGRGKKNFLSAKNQTLFFVVEGKEIVKGRRRPRMIKIPMGFPAKFIRSIFPSRSFRAKKTFLQK